MTRESLRRTPQQARSQQRVNHILDTAAAIFAEVGYESATTNAIAGRAGISIGSLYQFFPNKDAMMEALVERYSQDMREVLGRTLTLEVTAGLHVSEILGRYMQIMSEFAVTHAAFRPLFISSQLPAAQGLHREVINMVVAMLAVRYPELPPDQRQQSAVISVGIVKGVMMLSSPPNNLPAEIIGREMVTAVLAYLRTVLVRAGITLKADMQ